MRCRRFTDARLAVVVACALSACAHDAPTSLATSVTTDAGAVVLVTLAGARALDDAPPSVAGTWTMHRIDVPAAQAIVVRAHAAGLRVAAYVTTTHDFDASVRLGMDVVAPLHGRLDRDETLSVVAPSKQSRRASRPVAAAR